NRLVHDLLHLNLAGQQLSLALAMIKLALDEALQARQVHVDIARYVASGNLLGSDGGNGLLEWNRPDLSTPRPTLAHPFVPVAQHFLVLLELLGHSVKRGLNGDGCRGSAFLSSHLPRREPQVEQHRKALARRVLLENPFEMHEFRAKYLKILAQNSCISKGF